VKAMEIKLNLASKPYLNRQAVRLWLLLVCALLLLFLVFNVLYGFQNYREKLLLKDRMLELEAQLANLPGGATGYTPEKLVVLKDEITLAREIVAADQFQWTHLLGRFEELVPNDVSLRTIQPDFRTHSLKISGFARNVSAMTLFIDNLLGSEDLNQVFLERHAEVESDQQGGLPQMQTGFSLIIREAF
jgi:Tfp pilus assembly protein PilN